MTYQDLGLLGQKRGLLPYNHLSDCSCLVIIIFLPALSVRVSRQTTGRIFNLISVLILRHQGAMRIQQFGDLDLVQ